MRDFLLFIHNLKEISYFVRYIFGFLVLILMLLAVTLAWVEDLSLGNAIYFTFITGLTVGYGDITPVTRLGKIVSVAMAFVGVVTTGIYVAVASKAVQASIHGERLRRNEFRPGQLERG